MEWQRRTRETGIKRTRNLVQLRSRQTRSQLRITLLLDICLILCQHYLRRRLLTRTLQFAQHQLQEHMKISGPTYTDHQYRQSPGLLQLHHKLLLHQAHSKLFGRILQLTTQQPLQSLSTFRSTLCISRAATGSGTSMLRTVPVHRPSCQIMHWVPPLMPVPVPIMDYRRTGKHRR